MEKRKLTDTYLAKSLKPAEQGKRYEVWDADARGLGVRVNDRGDRTFIYLGRFPGKPHPTRRTIGEYPSLTLKQARETAAEWRLKARDGIDPREEQRRQAQAEEARKASSFGAVAEKFIELALIGPKPEAPKQRTGHATARELRKEYAPIWDRPIDSIKPADIVAIIDGIASGERNSPAFAHNILGHGRRLFNWAISRGVYGLDRSPCDRLKPSQIIGPKTLRDRIFSDAELRAFWVATEGMGYPFGDMFRLLAITGQRLAEIAEASWPEFQLGELLLIIPGARMKAKATHVVPLSDDAVAIINGLPRFPGPYLFTTTAGRRPVSGFSKAKARLETLMLAELRKQAERRGEDSMSVVLPQFGLHDIRRTMRTGLSSLPIPDLVRELAIAHSKPGLHRVYDQHAYLEEKREAMALWSARLRGIVEPPPAD